MKKIAIALGGTMLASTLMYANDAKDIQALKEEIAQLKEVTQTLIDETSDLKTGFNYTTVDTDKSHSGLGAAASKVYYSKSPLSIGGYGEMYYARTSGDSPQSSVMDVYRFVPYIGYKFSDNIILNTEIEFEHGGVEAGGGGEVIVEFMYLDFLLNKNLNVRLGNFLIPVGLINERHEPTLFTTVQRPKTSKYLIPSTWSESGVMAYGEIAEGLEYKLAYVTALDTQTNGDKWIRKGRGGTFVNNDPKFAAVARVDYTALSGLLIGASGYYSGSSTKTLGGSLGMWDIHVDYKYKGARVYGVYTQTQRSDAKEIAPDATKEAKGGFVNGSFDVLSLSSSSYSLPLFVQYEKVHTEAKRADNTSNKAMSITTLGVNFFPHEQVVLKADYALQTQGGIKDNTLSLSLGYIF